VDRMSKSRAERAKALEEWAERVESSDLTEADTEALRMIAELAERRVVVEEELTEAVRSAPGSPQLVRDRHDARCLEAGSTAKVRVEGQRVDNRLGTMAAPGALNPRWWDEADLSWKARISPRHTTSYVARPTAAPQTGQRGLYRLVRGF